MKLLNKKGFTLIELIVVIAILGILMLILVPSFLGYNADAKEITCRSNRVNIERLYKYKKIDDSSMKLIDYLSSSDKGNNLSEFKCPSRGVYSVNEAVDPYHVLCDEHESVDSPGTGETPDDSNKINGTDLTHNSIKHFKEGEVTDSALHPGTIITIDGQQYIVNTNIGKGNLIKKEMDNQTIILTMDVATKVSGKLPASWDEKSEFYKNQNIGRTKGSKIFYQGNYYVLNRNLSNGDYPDIGSTSNAWQQIIGT